MSAKDGPYYFAIANPNNLCFYEVPSHKWSNSMTRPSELGPGNLFE